MSFDFSKLHGLGNDYVFVDTFHQILPNDLAELSRKVSCRHFGIGSDGLILVGPSEKASFRMRIFNADGSEAQMCGNGLRCASKFAYEKGLISGSLSEPSEEMKQVLSEFSIRKSLQVKTVDVETGRGVLAVALLIEENQVRQVCVNMDQPILEAEKIPTTFNVSPVIGQELTIAGQTYKMTCVSMGNPHAVIFCDDVSIIDLKTIGPKIECHPVFPERTNVHFVQVIRPNRVKMITWERGSGITLACGTGASAVCAAGVLEKRTHRSIEAELPGGILSLLWNESNNCVYKLGSATEVFAGRYLM